ncbi:MAG TPA: hypothetical protein VFI78_05135 [Salinimicrobium sp.]|nr:hypothetical protein [Salinimicrobium sp.]
MNFLFKLSSYLFHPIWMPFVGAVFYFLVTPRFFPYPVIKAKLIAIAIMTLFIPIVFYFMLNTIGKAGSYFLEDVKERRLPLLFYIALNGIILKFVLDAFDFPALYYYFFGILISSVIGLLFVMFRKKISLHLMGLAGITMFIVALSFHFRLNLIYTIGFLVAIMGLTASARLHYKAHSYSELVLGFFIGLIPQIAVLFFWL